MAWPTKGPDFNAWNVDLDKFMAILAEHKDAPYWCCDLRVKYLVLRIDTRDNAFVLADRDGNKISPDQVLKAIETYKEIYHDRPGSI